MHHKKIQVLLGVLALCILASVAQGGTVYVNVYESADNVTVIPHAVVYVNGVMAGKSGGDGTMNFVYPGPGSADIRVSKAGYEDWTGYLGTNTSSVLVPLSRRNLTFRTVIYDADTLTPISGARVVISGLNHTAENKTDTAGSAVFQVKGDAGYTIEVSAPDYQARSAVINAVTGDREIQYWLFRDDRITFRVIDEQTLEPVQDALIQVDATTAGTTDARGTLTTDLAREKIYMFRVTAPGYENAIEKRLVGEEESLIDINMTRSPYQVFVSVYDESRSPVEGARVSIDGRDIGETNTYGRYSVQDLVAGTYMLVVSSPGYLTRSMQFQVDREGQDITVPLVYSETSLLIFVEDMGQKVIPGVTISINNSTAGVTDSHGQFSTRVRLNTPYQITAEKEGYHPGTVQERITNVSSAATTTIFLENVFDPLPYVIAAVIIIAVIAAILVIRHRNARRYGHSSRRDRI